MNPHTVKNVFDRALDVARMHVFLNPPTNNFPCGLAWMVYRCRKNAKESGALKEIGFKWESYRKCYIMSMRQWTNTQNLVYQEGLVDAMLDEISKINPEIRAKMGQLCRID